MKKTIATLIALWIALINGCSSTTYEGTYVSTIQTYTAPFEKESGPPGNFIVELYNNFGTTNESDNKKIVGRFIMYDYNNELLGKGEIGEGYKDGERWYGALDEGEASQVFSLKKESNGELLWEVEFVAWGGVGAPFGGTSLKRVNTPFEELTK